MCWGGGGGTFSVQMGAPLSNINPFTAKYSIIDFIEYRDCFLERGFKFPYFGCHGNQGDNPYIAAFWDIYSYIFAQFLLISSQFEINLL